MRINIDGLTVYFPYPRVYPEQFEYMCSLKQTIDAGGHALLEMPTGTGKTVTLLSFITSYHLQRPEMAKLIYCTRTVGEMQKVLEELRVVIEHRDRLYLQDVQSSVKPPMLALGLTTRRNLCLHDQVAQSESREEADAKCRSLTASWIRNSPSHDRDLCQFFENYDKEGSDSIIPQGIYTLDDMLQFGRVKKWCPYYTARHSLSFANIIVYNYQYLLDPKISGLISKNLARESIVVFDEAHNIDNICIDALTVTLREATLRKGLSAVRRLKDGVLKMRENDEDRLTKEYAKLVKGLSTSGLVDEREVVTDLMLGAPVIDKDIIEESVPGNIRKAEHFINFLRRFIQFLRHKKMNGTKAHVTVPIRLLHEIKQEMMEDTRPLRFCSERLKSLLQTIQITDIAPFTPLQIISDFATLLSTYGHDKSAFSSNEAYMQSFSIIFEPVDDRLPNIPDPILRLVCLDASLCMKPIIEKFHTVILTSGTLSPMEKYSQILGFQPILMKSFKMSMQRQSMCPVIISRGSDQSELTSRYQKRGDHGVIRNYGNLAIEIAALIPDGMVIFFTSYIYMEQMITAWHDMGIIQKLFERKLVFIETPDSTESALALDRYRKSCDTGRGAIFLCVARGKVAEGIDFDRHYGRCVLIIGIPFQYTEDLGLRCRLEFMRVCLGIKENEFLSFDAMRQTAQCAGRVIRNKNDYGIVLLADKRYSRIDKRNKLPQWILNLMPDSQVDVDSTSAINIVRGYIKAMAQPLSHADLHKVLLTEQEVDVLSKETFK